MQTKPARPKQPAEPSTDPETRRDIPTLHFLFQCQPVNPQVTHLGLGCWDTFSALHITSVGLSPSVLILGIALLSLSVCPILLYRIRTPASLQLLHSTAYFSVTRTPEWQLRWQAASQKKPNYNTETGKILFPICQNQNWEQNKVTRKIYIR